MDTAMKIQMDVRNNAQDLQNYAMDLNNWEEEMKRKESALCDKYEESSIPPPRNKIKRPKRGGEKNSNKPKKISAYDYSAWDKFDVEKACAEIDEEDDDEYTHKEEKKHGEVVKDESTDDEEGDSGLTDKKRFSLIDEAFYEKEMGNEFVKKEQWTDAIKCYTNAINLDPENAIYYANRSLCFLKLKNFKSAETDATTAIQLDKNYIKAYQRRAFARQALGQLPEAQSDYEQILKLEPKNALARVEFNKIDAKLKKEHENLKATEKKVFDPKNMFKKADKSETPESAKNSIKKQPVVSKISESSIKTPSKSADASTGRAQASKPAPGPEINDKNQKTESTIKEETNKNSCSKIVARKIERGDGDNLTPNLTNSESSGVFKPLPEWCKIIYPVNLPPHKRSKKPLKRINISFTDTDEDTNSTLEENKESVDANKRKEESTKTPELVAIETGKSLNKTAEDEELRNERLSFEVPKTAIQFQKCWKILKKNPEETYSYLKKIPGAELPQIFENSLESDFFSELINFLGNDEVKKEPDIIYNFLLGLSKVKRFSSIILFMSEMDRKCLKKVIGELANVRSKEETSQLLRLYELKV